MSKPVYFVTVSHSWQGVLFAGHWYANDAAAARAIALGLYSERQRGELQHYPAPDACEVRARRSNAIHNALNPSEAA